jgi:hypothetical protein
VHRLLHTAAEDQNHLLLPLLLSQQLRVQQAGWHQDSAAAAAESQSAAGSLDALLVLELFGPAAADMHSQG